MWEHHRLHEPRLALRGPSNLTFQHINMINKNSKSRRVDTAEDEVTDPALTNEPGNRIMSKQLSPIKPDQF